LSGELKSDIRHEYVDGEVCHGGRRRNGNPDRPWNGFPGEAAHETHKDTDNFLVTVCFCPG
jgi:hypothetical protein